MTRALVVFAVVWLVDASASACEPMPCQSGWMLPDGGRIPDNAPGIVWSPRRGYGPAMTAEDFAEQVHLFRGERETPSQVRSWGITGAFFVTPRTGGLRAGTTYRLTAPQRCNVDGPPELVTEVEIGPHAEPPTELGTLGVRAPERGRLQVSSSGGGCSAVDLAVFVDVEVRHHASAQPWADLLMYETRVDGEPYRASASLGRDPVPGASWVGRGRDRIYALCDPAALGEGGVEPGTHRVSIVATIPGMEVRIESSEARIELDCGREREPVVEPAAPEEPASASDDDGLCAAAGGPRSGAGLGFAVVLSLWVRRRRRRP